MIISSIILIGHWLYQYTEIVPAIWKEQTAPLGFIEAGITLGFLGICGLCWLTFARSIISIQSRTTSTTH